MKLTKAHMALLKEVDGGADVWGIVEATLLRQCEKDGLVVICKPQADPPGEKRQPYFGCILTSKGKSVLKKVVIKDD